MKNWQQLDLNNLVFTYYMILSADCQHQLTQARDNRIFLPVIQTETYFIYFLSHCLAFLFIIWLYSFCHAMPASYWHPASEHLPFSSSFTFKIEHCLSLVCCQKHALSHYSVASITINVNSSRSSTSLQKITSVCDEP